MRRRSLRTIVLVLVLVLLQAPLAATWWTQHRLASDGEREQVAATAADDGEQVAVRLPDAVVEALVAQAGDEAGDQASGRGLSDDDRTFQVAVDDETWQQVSDEGTAEVRWDAEDPTTFAVAGQKLPLGGVLVLDVIVLVALGLAVLLRRRRRPELRMVSDDALAVDDGEPVLERLGGQRYRVRGVVAEVGDGRVWLDVADRRVRVSGEDLGPLAPSVGDTVSVVGTMVG
ncbi:hypothetical protein [Nocardioides bruguierae]|uniref:Uncharacterized protein n=1 Tax=Nocardioides bruguierae TaxID=2945102 RepID=A0A9X2DAH5_9ACTN|nr:hypothetical protein [Nocardioides bruguierae]MCL8026763.1 hypothetical protein [Nocardioides bruguierae]MCM0621029.1 hypothetical protein [Nocardioides bruguierae]